MSTEQSVETQVEHDLWHASDHKPLQVKYNLHLTRRIPRQDLKPRIMLIRQPTTQQLKNIFMHPNWPELPFIEVAQQLNLTKTVYYSPEAVTKLRNLVNKVASHAHDPIRLTEDTMDELKSVLDNWISSKKRKTTDHDELSQITKALIKCANFVPPSLLKKAYDKLEVADPKQFFTTLKYLARLRKKGHIAQAFKTGNPNDPSTDMTQEDPNFARYLKNLY